MTNTVLEYPATYYNGVVFPQKKLSKGLLRNYNIVIQLKPKDEEEDAYTRQLVQEGLDDIKRGDYISLGKNPSRQAISLALWD